MNKLFICQTFIEDLGLLIPSTNICGIVLSSTFAWIKNTFRYEYEIICFIFSLTSE